MPCRMSLLASLLSVMVSGSAAVMCYDCDPCPELFDPDPHSASVCEGNFCKATTNFETGEVSRFCDVDPSWSNMYYPHNPDCYWSDNNGTYTTHCDCYDWDYCNWDCECVSVSGSVRPGLTVLAQLVPALGGVLAMLGY